MDHLGPRVVDADTVVSPNLHAYLTLLLAPAYITWKLGVYLVAVAGLGNEHWVRTARTAGNGTEEGPEHQSKAGL